jgi:vitamin K-dependent gamma-carboxylase
MGSKIHSLLKTQFDQVDNSGLVLFRIIFGFLIFLESIGAIFTGWVNSTFIQPSYTFTVIGFEWLQPLPGNGMYYYFTLMAILGLMAMVGYKYRFSIGLFTILWTATYLMQKANYNNHYYLLILLCLFMCLCPASNFASIDSNKNPQKASLTCPKWCINIFKLQLWIVFTYAATAKLYPGWLSGDFINLAFMRKVNYPIIGPFLQQEWFQTMVVYGGILFDFLIIYGLLWKKTRVPAFIIALLFHLFNSAVFQIGIFPYLMIALCIFFFDPDTIRQKFFRLKPFTLSLANEAIDRPKKILLFILGFFFLFQFMLPSRHYIMKGDAAWTEEGHRLSWRMMLRTKSGSIKFLIKNPENDSTWLINPATEVSAKQANSMAGKPDMIWQFSQKIKQNYYLQGIKNIEIYARSSVRLNKGDFHSIIDPNQNLAVTKWDHFKHSSWILSPAKE